MSEAYFAHKGINSSSLKCYADTEEFSPRKAVYSHRFKKWENKQHFVKGHSVHSIMENKGDLSDNFVISPYPDFRKNEAKEWKKSMLEQGKSILKEEELAEIEEMSMAVWYNTPKYIQDLIHHADTQRELELYPEQFKAMLDLYNPTMKVVADYKTTRHDNMHMIERDAYKLKYHIQAHQYTMCAKKEGLDVEEFYFIFVSTVAPFEVFALRCSEQFLEKGEEDWNIAYERLKEYEGKHYNDVPSAYTDIIDLNIPAWALTKTEDLEWDTDEEETDA